MSKGGEKAKPTAYERNLAEIAMKELNIYEKRMVPFRNNFTKDVTRASKVTEDRVAGEINADFAQAGKEAIPGDPSMRTSAIPTERVGRKQALATVSGTQSVRDLRLKGMQAGIDLSQGDATTAQLGITGLARTSVSEAIAEGQNDQARSAAVGDMIGSLAGVGAAGYKNFKSPPSLKADYAVDTTSVRNYSNLG